MSRSGALPLRGVVQTHDWGSTTAIPELLGVPPDGRPQAELWLGAHPMASAEACLRGTWLPLDRLLAESPVELLGPAVVDRFGNRLPFLIKVLAAARPLSLQVHPTMAQAREGYAREEAAAVPRRAPYRTYRDRNHKPELLVALTPFDALSGFRPPEEAGELLGELARAGARPLRPWATRLAEGDLYGTFWDLWDLPDEQCARLVEATAPAARRLAGSTEARWHREAAWTARLAAHHPADPGVVVALLLNLLRLEPGQALYAPAGRLHAYLEGVGLEVMASSDNVIRGGLTSKHVDLAELEHVLLVRPEPVELTEPVAVGVEATYPTPAAEFRLSRLDLDAGGSAPVGGDGPEVLLCLEGTAQLDGLPLGRGEAAFLPAAGATEVVAGAKPRSGGRGRKAAEAGASGVAPGAGGVGASLWRVGIGSLEQYREPERRRRDRDR